MGNMSPLLASTKINQKHKHKRCVLNFSLVHALIENIAKEEEEFMKYTLQPTTPRTPP